MESSHDIGSIYTLGERVSTLIFWQEMQVLLNFAIFEV
jgi:hypothetical protein